MLCHNCNVSIGLVYDQPWVLRKLADYLEENGCFDKSPEDENPLDPL